MSNIDRAADILEPHAEMWWTGSKEAARDLDSNGLLAPAPQIIRTPAELEALDPDTLLHASERDYYAHVWGFNHFRLPAVVVASGEHVRACREALEQENA